MLNFFISNLIDEIQRNELQITGFYPYTTVVRNAIVRSEFIDPYHIDKSSLTDQTLLRLWKLIESKFDERGITTDNKIAVSLQFSELSLDTKVESGIFYVGWYDNRVSIGLSVDCEDMGDRGIRSFRYRITQKHLENYIHRGLRLAGYQVGEILWKVQESEDCENLVEVKVHRAAKLSTYGTELVTKLERELLQNFNVELILI